MTDYQVTAESLSTGHSDGMSIGESGFTSPSAASHRFGAVSGEDWSASAVPSAFGSVTDMAYAMTAEVPLPHPAHSTAD